jgi:hypothetical protein
MRKEKLEVALAGLSASLAIGGGGCSAEGGRSGASAGSGIASIGSMSSSPETGAEDDSSGLVPTDGSSAASDPSAAPSDDDDGPTFDLGIQPDVMGQVPEQGCTKVDFLFVIDNSGSMGDNQADLADNFPNFIDGIQATLDEVDDFQVGVITSDAYQPNPVGCRQLGALVTRTDGVDSSNAVCGPYAEGHNYMTQADDLATTFACAAKPGSEGDGLERMANAMEVAVRKDLGGPGGCNDGFIRDDALLVIVLITDEWDGPGDPEFFGSTGNAASWYDTVVMAKGGIPENIVVVSLVHTPACPPTDGLLSGDLQPFTELFGANGFVGCITDDYGTLFDEATGIIGGACENFMPPG